MFKFVYRELNLENVYIIYLKNHFFDSKTWILFLEELMGLIILPIVGKMQGDIVFWKNL